MKEIKTFEDLKNRLEEMEKQIYTEIKVFEKTHDLEYIVDYNIYTTRDLIQDFKKIIDKLTPNQN